MLSAFLDKTVQHERGTATKGALGGTSWTYAVQTADVRAAIWPAPGHVVTEYARRDMRVNHQLVTSVDLGARQNDRFVLGAAVYLVRGVGTFSNALVSAETLYVHDVERVVV